MTYAAPPARNEISDTYPNPSNAVARVGFGKLWDYVTGLLGSTGNPTAAKAALLVPQDVDFTNRIINGAMMIDQRNAGASVTSAANGTYFLDRWRNYQTANSKFSVQQSSTAPAGFTKSMLITSLSAYSVGAGDILAMDYRIEGNNVADLAWGTASAATVTLSFWVRSSLTGTFGGAVSNSAGNRSYPFTYTVNSANTFEYKTVTIAGDTSGTWLTDTGVGIELFFSLGTGSTYSGTAGSWSGSQYTSATGATSVVGTSGATFYITGVQLEKGTAATGFAYRPYGAELALCQRYYYRNKPGAVSGFGSGLANTTNSTFANISFPVTMRIAPTALEQSGAASDYTSFRRNGSVACTSVPSFQYANAQGCMTQFTTTGDFVQGEAIIQMALTSSSYLGWSAEL